MEHALGIELYNQFQGDKVIGWVDLLKIMGNTFGRSRDEVFNAMEEMIVNGKIVVQKEGFYCLPATLEKLQRKEQGGKEMKRSEFDRLSHSERAEYVNSGGRISA